MNAFLDLAERVFWTFTAAFLGLLVASPVWDNFGVGWQDALKGALFVGGLSAAKVLLAFAIDRQSGGQLLPGDATVEVKPDA